MIDPNDLDSVIRDYKPEPTLYDELVKLEEDLMEYRYSTRVAGTAWFLFD